MSIYRACLVPDNNILSRYILAMQPMANWLASALPVADAVSFKFDDINVTAQRVMTQTAPLMATCSPFTTSSSKTIVVVKFRRTNVFMRVQVSEKWDINDS